MLTTPLIENQTIMKRIRRNRWYTPLDDHCLVGNLQIHNISKLCQEDAEVKELVPIESLEAESACKVLGDSKKLVIQLNLWPVSRLSTLM